MNLGNRHSQHSFAQIPSVNIQRSMFDRSFASKDTFMFDDLVPLFVDEVLPGDTINLNVKSFLRLAPQVRPLMDNMYVDYFFFFVPNRLVWDNWERFNGAQDNPSDSTDYLVPYIDSGAGLGFAVGSIYDHFGIPTLTPNLRLNALPLRGYNLIWNEWFRDQNLQDSLTVNKGDGPDANTDYALVKRAKKHDYFTSALPWPQKGDAITLPLGTSAPIKYDTFNGTPIDGSEVVLRRAGGGNFETGYGLTHGTLTTFIPTSSDHNLYADLSSATAATINSLRLAMMTQSLLELDARGGTRYVEILKAHFNVISPDFRLQRPEFLSGGTSRMAQHPIAQTSESTAGSPQGNLAAYSTAAQFDNSIGFSKSFVEHGFVIGLIQARGEVTYQQGLNRMWSRSTRYDYFWPKLQELGEQTILNKEIYASGNAIQDLGIFGYQERFAEYRYSPSQVKGQFRSTYSLSLDVWHLAEEFGTLPVLNDEFIQSNTPIERALTLPDPAYPHILADFFFDIKHARPMVTYGVPATLGRF